MSVLVVENLTVDFGKVRAVDSVSFQLEAGEVLGLVGPNGAGKSTCIDAIAGAIPHQGTVHFNNRFWNPGDAHSRARQGLVRTFQSLHLFEDLSVRENVFVGGRTTTASAFLADVLGATITTNAVREHALALCQLEPFEHTPVHRLSTGTRHLVAIARALAMQPSVLLLDEPAAGLDAQERTIVRELVGHLAGSGASVVLVEHDFDFVAAACDRVIVLDQGRLIANETPAALRMNSDVIRAYLGPPVKGPS